MYWLYEDFDDKIIIYRYSLSATYQISHNTFKPGSFKILFKLIYKIVTKQHVFTKAMLTLGKLLTLQSILARLDILVANHTRIWHCNIWNKGKLFASFIKNDRDIQKVFDMQYFITVSWRQAWMLLWVCKDLDIKKEVNDKQ